MSKFENLKIVNNPDLSVEYKVYDINMVAASHIPYMSFSKNPLYTYENERLYHAESGSKNKVLNMAARLDADHLLNNNLAASGAPIVDKSLNVLGGNGRAMAIMFACEHFKDRYAAYKARVLEYAKENGIKCENIAEPILVRELREDINKAQAINLISALNDDFTASRNALADARTRGLRISEKTLKMIAQGLIESDSLREFFDQSESLAIVQSLINDGAILSQESNQYLDNDGYLRPDGKSLVETALRSRVFSSYESLARISAPILAKIDAIIPFAIITQKWSKWNIIPFLVEFTDLYLEYSQNSQKDKALFLRQKSFTQSSPVDRYSAFSIQLFKLFDNDKKKEIIARFKKYAYNASISLDASGLGIGLSQKDALQNCFDFIEAEPVISINTGKEVKSMKTSQIEINHEIKHSDINDTPITKKERKPRAIKRDCDKQNSTLIGKGFNTLDEILEYAQINIFGVAIELIPTCKTQNKVAINGVEISGYRLIKTGRQFQLRLLNGFEPFNPYCDEVEISESDVDNGKTPENITQKYSRKQTMIINKLIKIHGWQRNGEILSKKFDNEEYIIRIVKDSFIYEDNGLYFDKSAYQDISTEYAADWLNSHKLVAHNRKIRHIQSEKEQEENQIIKEKIEEIYLQLEKFGWMRNDFGLSRNLKGGYRGEINPNGNRIFHITSSNNKIYMQFRWDNYFEIEIKEDTDSIVFATEYNNKIIQYARESGEYIKPATLDGVLSESKAENPKNNAQKGMKKIESLESDAPKQCKQSQRAHIIKFSEYATLDYDIQKGNTDKTAETDARGNECQEMEEAGTATAIESQIDEIYCELEKLGWQRREIGVQRNLQGGYRVSGNPHGRRIFSIYDADNEMAIVCGTKIYSAEICFPMHTKAWAQKLNMRAIEYARQSGEYENHETLDGVLTKNAMPNVKKLLDLEFPQKADEETNKIENKVFEDYPDINVGTILYTIWGYDQTNVFFYKVIMRTKKRFYIRQLVNKRVYGDNWDGEVIAGNDFDNDKIITVGIGKRNGLCTMGHTLRMWDGKPRAFSSGA